MVIPVFVHACKGTTVIVLIAQNEKWIALAIPHLNMIGVYDPDTWQGLVDTRPNASNV